jgi:8-oxo-dGTP pyrophosphatase MutT (NUDIX family)
MIDPFDPPRPAAAVWTVHGTDNLHDGWWCRFDLDDVELPSGRRIAHESVRFERPAVGTTVVVDDALLMIWRHRLVPDTWGWEVPAGVVEADEDIAVAAQREVLEETGWSCGPVTFRCTWHPTSGTSDQRFLLYGADEAEHQGEPEEQDETAAVGWIPLDDLEELLHRGMIVDGMTVVAVWNVLARRAAGTV